jgi:hypothetical protein
MLTENHIKEGLSRAYILAVAHRAGFDCSFATGFDYGIDGAIHAIEVRPNGRRWKTGFVLEFQAKASHNCVFSDSALAYDLDVKNHDDLVETHVGAPRILIVLALPNDSAEWLRSSKEELVLKRCAYWASLRGQAPTVNTSTRRIAIPLSQTFDVAGLEALMGRVKKGESL